MVPSNTARNAQIAPITTMNGIQAIDTAMIPRIIDASANPFRCRFGSGGDGRGTDGLGVDGAVPSGSTNRWPPLLTSAVHVVPLK